MKRKPISQNKFEAIENRIMQCGVRKEVKVRRQEMMEEKVQYFRCWEVKHYKWECPMVKAEKEKRRKEEVVHMAQPQKAQQERRLAYPVWENTQEYCEEWNTPPEGTLLLEREWLTREMVATYMDYGECKSKEVQTHENQGQGFLFGRQLKNIWCSSCQKVWNWREEKAKREEMTRVQCVRCERRDAIARKITEQKRKEILCPEYRTGKRRE